MPELPICEYRVERRKAGVFFCRHTKVRAVNSLVTTRVCSACTYHSVPCAEPRPVVEEEEPPPVRSETATPAMPSLGQQFWNVATSLVNFVADGMQTVTAEEYAARLAICDPCPERVDTRCTKCGCNLALKARGRVFECPIGKWPKPAS